MAMSGFTGKLQLDKQGAWIFGVCAGLARTLNVNVDVVRLVTFVAALFLTKWIVAAYVIAWFSLDAH